MQGKLILGAILLGSLIPAAHAAESVKRPTCGKAETAQQAQQRQQQSQQQQREKVQDCRIPRNIPPVVDPTPSFLL
jgi:hypothetical protein